MTESLPAIEWIVFDLGGVLLTHDRKWTYQKLAQLLECEPDSVSHFVEKDQPIYQELGDKPVTPEEFHALLGHRYGKALSVDEAVSVMNAELGVPIESTVRIIEGLRGKYNIACLSNTNSLHWQWLNENCAFMNLFKVKLASQELRCSKPDQRIYDEASKVFQVLPSHCLFFDDRPENVEGARSAGWNAELYTSEEKLINDLKKYNIS